MLRFFRQYYPIRNIFFVLGEGVFIYISVLLAAVVIMGPSALHEQRWFYLKLLFITGVCQACLYYNELYDLKVTDNVKELTIRLVQSLGAAAILLACVYVAFPELILRTDIFTVGAGIVVVLIVGWRLGYALVLSRGMFNQRIILLGSGELTKKIRNEIRERKDCGYTVAVEVPECIDDMDLERPEGVPLICRHRFEGLCELCHGLDIQKIVVSFKEKRNLFPTRELLRCRVEGIEVIEGNSFFEMLSGKLLVESINPGWLIFSGGFQKSHLRRIIKRATDLVVSIVLMIVLSPLILLAAIAIRLDTPGRIFFAQERVGFRRKPYMVYKFRSMVHDAEKLTGPKWADEDDPRITRVGRYIRRFRIDELPQLWNVLKGEMSMVGPRPERENFVQQLEKTVPYYGERFGVKPGITGWAQVNYGYGSSVADAVEKLNYDLFYIKNMSTMMDLLVVLKTIRIILFGHGVR